MDNQIIQIRKKGGLDSIVYNRGQKIRPEIYYQQMKDRDSDGIPQGVYKEGMILDAKHFISPSWDSIKKCWPWGGTKEDLTKLITRMKLKYEDNDKRAGEIIVPGKDVTERLTDFYDPVFRHSAFYGKMFMQDSRGSFDFTDPKQEFMYWVYKGDRATTDKSTNTLKSKYASGAKYELISPKYESKQKVQFALKDVDAKKFIGQLYGDDAKVRAICEAMDLATYRERVDTEAAWLMLDEVSQNTTTSQKYNGKSYQEMFLELCAMSDEDLEYFQKVVKARKQGHLRKFTDYFSFDGDKIHVKNNIQLVKYFKDPKNQEQLVKMLDLVESHGK